MNPNQIETQDELGRDKLKDVPETVKAYMGILNKD